MSKSKIAMFEQCPKRLRLSVHARTWPSRMMARKPRITTGHEVGVIARAPLPDGVMVAAEPGSIGDSPLGPEWKDQSKDEWETYRECRVGGDFLLIYKTDDGAGKTARSSSCAGMHADLFSE